MKMNSSVSNNTVRTAGLLLSRYCVRQGMSTNSNHYILWLKSTFKIIYRLLQ